MTKDSLFYNSPIVIRKILKRDSTDEGIRCFYCDHEFSKSWEGYANISIDHKIPRVEITRPGSQMPLELVDDINNLVIACRSCNASKGKRNDFFEFDGKNINQKKNGELERFKQARKNELQRNLEWVEGIFIDHNIDDQWLEPVSFLNELTKLLESQGYQNLKRVKDGVNFDTDDGLKLAFWIYHFGLYFREVIDKDLLADLGMSKSTNTIYIIFDEPKEVIKEIKRLEREVSKVLA